MLKTISIGALLLFTFFNSIAGCEIEFCTNADKLGNCLGKADEFHWAGEKIKVEVIVRNQDKLQTSKLQFRVFFMKNKSDGELSAELSIYTRPDWTSAVRTIYFFKPGYYKIDVFNDKNELITTGFVTISER